MPKKTNKKITKKSNKEKKTNTAKTIKAPKRKIAILCSGGNAPGMANCVLGFCKKCLASGLQPWAIANGLNGLHDRKWWILDPNNCQRYVKDGSAMIGTSRCPEFVKSKKYREQVLKNIKDANFEALVIVGGEGSYKAALTLSKMGVKVITIPATIDNDVSSTNYTIGFDTCLNKACSVIGDINDCFISHQGVALIEIMGRSCPDLTIRTAIACNSTYMVTKYSLLERDDFVRIAKDGLQHGKFNINFIITEKLYGNPGQENLKNIAKYIENKLGLMCRHVVVGYMQRGGAPTARDRLLANYMTNHAVNCILKGKVNRAICYVNRTIYDMDLEKAINVERKSMNETLVKTYNEINRF